MKTHDELWFVVNAKKQKIRKIIDSDGDAKKTIFPKFLSSRLKKVDFTQEGLREKFRLMRAFAQNGGAIMKGPLKREIKEESRSGLSDTQALTSTLVFDFDDLKLPDGDQISEKVNAAEVQRLAELVITMLPPVFRKASYIAQASSRFGIKKDRSKLSLHIEFWLEDPIAPAMLKDYLLHLNLKTDYFRSQMRKHREGHGLSKTLDVCLHQNSRMIIIGYPHFMTAAMNPFGNDDDRLILVEKDSHTVNLTTELMGVDGAWNKQEEIKILKAVLKAEGQTYAAPKYASVKVSDLHSARVIKNPEPNTMIMYGDHGDYCSFNLGAGTNHAYLVDKRRPALVKNMTSDSYFFFEACDPETYRWFTEEYLTAKKSEGDSNSLPAKQPICYLERISDTYRYGYYNQDLNRLEDMHVTKHINAMQDWYGAEGYHMPDGTQFVSHVFAPNDERTVDLKNGFVNTFEPNELFLDPPNIPDHLKGAGIVTANSLKEICPVIYRLLRHMLDDPEEVGYFLNWLAFIWQKHEKPRSCYVIQGVPGTGKGVLIEKVIEVMFGQHCHRVRIPDLLEKYNEYIENNLVLVMDEFKHSFAGGEHDRLGSILRELITEIRIPLRGMRKIAPPIDTFFGVLIFSNEFDAVHIPDKERRYHVCPRQEIPIIEIYPDWDDQVPLIEKELGQFSSYLKHFKLDEGAARRPRHTEAKEEMRESSMRSHEVFANALKTGDLEFFLEVMDIPVGVSNRDLIKPAQNYVRAWLRNHKQNQISKLFLYEMQSLYQALIEPRTNPVKFGLMLKRLGLKNGRVFRDGLQKRGMEVNWQLDEVTHKALMKTYCKDVFSHTTNENDEERQLPS